MQELSPQSMRRASDEVKRALDGGVEPLFSEDVDSMEFEELKQRAKAADQAAKADPSPSKMGVADFATALYRDARYSHASRRALMALGAHGRFSAHYLASKAIVDAGGDGGAA